MTTQEITAGMLSVLLHGSLFYSGFRAPPAPLPRGNVPRPSIEVEISAVGPKSEALAQVASTPKAQKLIVRNDELFKKNALTPQFAPSEKRVPEQQKTLSKVPPGTKVSTPQNAQSPGSSSNLIQSAPREPNVGTYATYNPKPIYPRVSRRLRHEGTTLLRVSVSATGQVIDVHVERSSGFSELDESALSAVRQWRFQPGTVAGVAISAEVGVPIRFQLNDRE